jgi:hypothetical protein
MKLFSQDGFPTKEGLKALKPFQDSLKELLDTIDVKDMSAMEMRTLRGWLAKIVGDTASNVISSKL